MSLVKGDGDMPLGGMVENFANVVDIQEYRKQRSGQYETGDRLEVDKSVLVSRLGSLAVSSFIFAGSVCAVYYAVTGK